MNNDFTLHTPTSAPGASQGALELIEKTWGFIPNLHRVLAESPVALEAYATLWTLAEKTSFTPEERNLAYLAIIYENECEYCMAGHSNLSRVAGVESEHVAAIRNNSPIANTKLEALRVFAATVTRQRGAVSEAAISTFKAAGYTNQSILDVLVLAAAKLISNYTNHFAETPLDPFMRGAEWRAPGKLRTAA